MRQLSIFIIRIYQSIGPMFGVFSSTFGLPSQCKYPTTCSTFAIQELERKSFLSAARSIFRRLISCSPFARILKAGT